MRPGPQSSDASFPTPWNGRIWFAADDGIHGRELWMSDGTALGTRLARDIRKGSASSNPSHLTVVGTRHLYFAAEDEMHGIELWRSDGSSIGTQLAADINPQFNSSEPKLTLEGGQQRFAVLWGDVIFSADDGHKGRELWKVHNGATANRIGDGFAPSTRALPELRADDPVLGATVRVDGFVATGAGSFAVTVLGVADARPKRLVPGADAWSYVDLSQGFLIANVSSPNASGRFGFQFQIPNQSALVGVRAALQTWALPSNSSAGFELSNGVTLYVGR